MKIAGILTLDGILGIGYLAGSWTGVRIACGILLLTSILCAHRRAAGDLAG